ncbi:MAG: glycerol-3-phosphate 1-O-acyltransferase PlsY [Proteobacteria bacterium]|nr:glycerol-3-phosphate 1-O-acyltransferase PlsY [Pseudomonadota bacterium]
MDFIWLLIGYLFGSASSAIIVCRVLGHGDPRSEGSGNPGTTNVLRLYGKTAAALTFFGDVAKGIIPVLACTQLGFEPSTIALAGTGAFLGHLYPIFFRFEGGKGVATLVGVLLAFNPWLGLAFMASWITVALATRYSSVAALSATALAPIFAHLFGAELAVVSAVAGMAALVYWRHQSNIRNLLAGRESKIGKS